jgi:RND superfamily putative drug exporter
VLVFAPAVLVLAGKGSWWVPGWLDRILPHMDVEGAGAPSTTGAAVPTTSHAPRRA